MHQIEFDYMPKTLDRVTSLYALRPICVVPRQNEGQKETRRISCVLSLFTLSLQPSSVAIPTELPSPQVCMYRHICNGKSLLELKYVPCFCRSLQILLLHCTVWAGYLGRYSDWLRAGRSGDRIPLWARYFAPVQTGPEAHPSSCTMG